MPESISNIILVDDNRLDNYTCRHLLFNSGFRGGFFEFTDPISALDFLTANSNIHLLSQNTLLLLDVNMPYMNGFELLYSFDNSRPELCAGVQVIMLSNYSGGSDVEMAYRPELVADYIVKPLTQEKIRNRIAKNYQLVA